VAEVVKEMIDPEIIPENLTRPELVKLLAEQMSAANKESLYKKSAESLIKKAFLLDFRVLIPC
jgi:ATP sulfurylase